MIYLATLIFAIGLASFANSLPLGNTTNVANTYGCEPGEIECSKCFDILVNELVSSDRNRYNLQRAFFPPDTTNPVFVNVTYYFTRNMSGNGSTDYSLTSPNQTWFWTQSTFYLFQPVESLQYSSLLFSDPSLRESEVFLYLEQNCMKADLNMLKLLTQRLKLYATEQKVAAHVSDTYSAKGESRETLTFLFSGTNPLVPQGLHLTRYTISFHVVFPLVVIFFLVFLFHHLIENKKINFFKQSRESNTGNKSNAGDKSNTGDERKWEPKISSRNMYIYIAVFGSLTFIVYVLVLDCLAVGYRNAHDLGNIFYKQRTRDQFDNKSRLFFEGDYAIPHIMFAYDIIICLVVLVGLTCACCGLKKSWYYVLLGPCSCVVVHSYHILVGYIHAPYHASAVLIFYAIAVLVFVVSYQAAYYNIVHCFKCRKIADKTCCSCCLPESKEKCYNGNFCISRNLNYFEAGCRKSVIHRCLFGIFVLLAFLLSGILVFVVILFLIVPINLAIDDAPNRLLNINQTILIFITAAITYKLYRNKSNGTILDQLVKANTKKLKPPNHCAPPPDPTPAIAPLSDPSPPGNQPPSASTPLPVTDYDKWKSKNKSDKQTEMAELLLDALQALKQMGRSRE